MIVCGGLFLVLLRSPCWGERCMTRVLSPIVAKDSFQLSAPRYSHLGHAVSKFSGAHKPLGPFGRSGKNRHAVLKFFGEWKSLGPFGMEDESSDEDDDESDDDE